VRCIVRGVRLGLLGSASRNLRVRGSVSGLDSGASVTLRNGAGRTVVDANGRFVFETQQESGTAYRVTVEAAPEDRHCAISNGRGTVGAVDVVDITVDCSDIVEWGVGGEILASVLSQDGSTLYVGGKFNQVGPPTGSFARLDRVTGKPSSTLPKFDGAINVAIGDGSGGWYVAGAFGKVDGQPTPGSLVHVLDDGTIDENFAPQPNARVNALAISGTKLFVAGFFTSIGGQERLYLAAIDSTSGQVLPWAPVVDGTVWVLASGSSALYLAGDFGRTGGATRLGAAALDPDTGEVLPWNPAPQGGDGISTLLVADEAVYVGGSFDAIGGTPQANLAAVDAHAGAATAWRPQCAGCSLSDMALVDATLYVAGFIVSAGGEQRSGLAAFNARTGAVKPWNPRLTANYGRPLGSALDVHGDVVYVGGYFDLPQPGLAAFDSTVGNPVEWAPAGTANSNGSTTVSLIHADADHVYVAGYFDAVAGEPRSHLV
jgi:trimeric autotransporter adhesin